MIAVIADDFTGAAEIGGLGLLYGIKTAIISQVKKIDGIDLLIISTEMRSMTPQKAERVSKNITKELLKLNPEFIYKKIDSVLRGNVIAEIEAQLKASGKKRVFMLPANPNLSRTIIDGIYYIDKKPLMESKFSDDQVFTSNSSNVLDILNNTGKLSISSLSHNQKLLERGLIIGNTQSMEDLKVWANLIDSNTLPSGAAGFFSSILEKKYKLVDNHKKTLNISNKNALYICGSNFPLSRQSVIKAEENHHFVSSMPNEIYYNKTFDQQFIKQWGDEIINEFKTNKKVIVSVPQQKTASSISGKQIKKVLGELIKIVHKKIKIDELFIEGGATAFRIIKDLEIDTFYPIQSFAPGVVRMQIGNSDELYLTVKPGSYLWPESIWKFN